MIRKLSSLPRRVYEKHGAYYFVTIERKWIRLCAVADGLSAMYEALAATLKADNTHDSMPAVIGRWVDSKLGEWADKTATDQERISKVMAEAFADLAPAQVTTPVCVAYLKTFAETPRTYNLHRTMLRQVLAFAALEGLREGYNPVDNVPTQLPLACPEAVSYNPQHGAAILNCGDGRRKLACRWHLGKTRAFTHAPCLLGHWWVVATGRSCEGECAG